MAAKRKAFTLIELLAVIVILAIILIMAVPRILEVINASKKSTLESSTKLIAKNAENKKVEKEALGQIGNVNCTEIVDYNSKDYDSCEINFTDGVAKVKLVGKGKFEGLTCEGTKDAVTCGETNEDETSGVYAFGSITNKSNGVTDASTLNKLIFIKYPDNIDTYTNDTQKSVCAILQGNINCYKASSDAYSKNRSKLLKDFDESNCNKNNSDGVEKTICTYNKLACWVQIDGAVNCSLSSPVSYCEINNTGVADCKFYGGTME